MFLVTPLLLQLQTISGRNILLDETWARCFSNGYKVHNDVSEIQLNGCGQIYASDDDDIVGEKVWVP